jgi:sulfate transport system permease protein
MSSRRGVLPGFRLSLGYSLVYLAALVVLPLSAVMWKASTVGLAKLVATIATDRAAHAIALSVGASFVAALINAVFGVAVAWTLVRYRFPGRALLDALVDVPFALPTAVGGIALAGLYAKNGWVGHALAKLGVEVAFTRAGIVLALTFIGLPFIVRTVQPVLRAIEPEQEEAAAMLGASRFEIARRVILPPLIPALITGFALAFARGLGEYGSVVFIAGNMPLRTEIAPLLVMTKLEQFDYAGATAIGAALLSLSFAMLFVVNRLEAWASRRLGAQIAGARA